MSWKLKNFKLFVLWIVWFLFETSRKSCNQSQKPYLPYGLSQIPHEAHLITIWGTLSFLPQVQTQKWKFTKKKYEFLITRQTWVDGTLLDHFWKSRNINWFDLGKNCPNEGSNLRWKNASLAPDHYANSENKESWFTFS